MPQPAWLSQLKDKARSLKRETTALIAAIWLGAAAACAVWLARRASR